MWIPRIIIYMYPPMWVSAPASINAVFTIRRDNTTMTIRGCEIRLSRVGLLKHLQQPLRPVLRTYKRG